MIESIEIDNLDTNRPELVEKPSLEDIMSNVIKLDDRSHTLIGVNSSSGVLMNIGGKKGDYVIYIFERDKIHNLLGNTKNNDPIIIVGQSGMYEDYRSDSVQMASALEYFYYNEKVNPELNWEVFDA